MPDISRRLVPRRHDDRVKMNMIRSVVRGYGAALPRRVVPNRELEGIVETSDEWIVQRTGIRQRYVAGEGETTAPMGEEQAPADPDRAGLPRGAVGRLLAHTA